MPPSTTLPVAGSWATCPLKKRKPSLSTAWENGPTGGASSGEVTAVLLISTPVATSLADHLHERRHPCTIAGPPTYLGEILLGQRRSDRLGLHHDARNSPSACFLDRLDAVDAARELLAIALQRVAAP